MSATLFMSFNYESDIASNLDLIEAVMAEQRGTVTKAEVYTNKEKYDADLFNGRVVLPKIYRGEWFSYEVPEKIVGVMLWVQFPTLYYALWAGAKLTGHISEIHEVQINGDNRLPEFSPAP